MPILRGVLSRVHGPAAPFIPPQPAGCLKPTELGATLWQVRYCTGPASRLGVPGAGIRTRADPSVRIVTSGVLWPVRFETAKAVGMARPASARLGETGRHER